MLASVAIESAGVATVPIVPDEAIQLLDGKPTVFIANPRTGGVVTFVRRRVEIGSRSGATVAVVRGLAAGELVVIAGAYAIKAEIQKRSMPAMEM
jgi:cobalt-zinc-cadmium efflux system membrane fusion protein